MSTYRENYKPSAPRRASGQCHRGCRLKRTAFYCACIATLVAIMLLAACGTATRCPEPFGCNTGQASARTAPNKPTESNGSGLGGSQPGTSGKPGAARPGAKPGPGKGDGTGGQAPGKGEGKGHGHGGKGSKK